MTNADVALLLSRLVFTAVASFLAIVLWSRTRDSAWMLMVVGTIASYADIVFTLLVKFGVADQDVLSPGGVPLASMVFSNLPTLMFIIAFAVMVGRKRIR